MKRSWFRSNQGFAAVLLLAVSFARPGLPLRADSTVVFNEVHYHAAGDDPSLEWVELHNQMAVDMDLSGWRIGGGISFDFPEGTILEGGGYLVVAKDPPALQAASGHAGAPAWSFSTRGRTTPATPAPRPGAASDETARSAWRTYSYRGVATDDGIGKDRFHELVVGLLDAGEVLIDDVRVVEDPGGAAVSFLTNGGFQGDSVGSMPSGTSAPRTDVPVDDNRWHHVAWVLDSNHPTDRQRFYFDGEEVYVYAEGLVGQLGLESTIGSAFSAGGVGNDPENWEGGIDEVALFADALSAGAIRAHYEAGTFDLDDPTDADGDGMPDNWELTFFGDTSRDGNGDFDSDGLADAAEFAGGADPTGSTPTPTGTALATASRSPPGPTHRRCRPLRGRTNAGRHAWSGRGGHRARVHRPGLAGGEFRHLVHDRYREPVLGKGRHTGRRCYVHRRASRPPRGRGGVLPRHRGGTLSGAVGAVGATGSARLEVRGSGG